MNCLLLIVHGVRVDRQTLTELTESVNVGIGTKMMALLNQWADVSRQVSK
jgi:hypothetical protein